MNIGIVGFGFVGKAIATGFKNNNLFIHDIDIKKCEPHKCSPIKTLVEECNFIFVCVSTPLTNKDFDDNSITSVIKKLDNSSKEKADNPIVIIKSAVIPSKVKEYLKYCRNIELVISPEYLRGRFAEHDFVNQKLMILGGKMHICERVKELFHANSICNKEAKIGICHPLEAALIKYMENSFLELKI